MSVLSFEPTTQFLVSIVHFFLKHRLGLFFKNSRAGYIISDSFHILLILVFPKSFHTFLLHVDSSNRSESSRALWIILPADSHQQWDSASALCCTQLMEILRLKFKLLFSRNLYLLLLGINKCYNVGARQIPQKGLIETLMWELQVIPLSPTPNLLWSQRMVS